MLGDVTGALGHISLVIQKASISLFTRWPYVPRAAESASTITIFSKSLLVIQLLLSHWPCPESVVTKKYLRVWLQEGMNRFGVLVARAMDVHPKVEGGCLGSGITFYASSLFLL